ncbi:MAG: peptidase M14 [Planctomycetota bacterium]|nr:MAG: peptidase M14 [Planctomycetota bacterium]
MERPRFDTYYTNEQLLAALQALARAHPGLVRLEALGRTHEGREIPIAIVTNAQTGPDTDKPGFWVDANLHATELAGSMAALHLLETVLARYRTEPRARRLADEQVLYVVPRLNLDGVAAALGRPPRLLRSGTRPYPWPERQPGLHPEDVDGDGRILQMRIEDPAGDWKVSARDPRLLVKRAPDEEGGTYYRLFAEGRLERYDGDLIKAAPPLAGLDFNRNFPAGWRPEGQQKGAGEHPGSEPEVQAVLEWFRTHPNIFGALTYHTFSRVLLRPFGYRADEEMEHEDLRVFEAIGRRATEITGYPCLSTFHHFKYHPKEVITGCFDDWLYEHKGIFAFTVELWDLPSAAGLEHKNAEKKFIEWFRHHPPEDDERIVRWVDAHAPGALVPWRPFEHPQLGPVELGGWDRLYSFTNPPPALLLAEIAPQTEFALAFAAMAPRLRWRAVQARALGEESWQVRAVVENVGFLSSSGSVQARKQKACREVRLRLELPAGAELLGGRPEVEVGHLEGRSNKLDASPYWASSDTDNRARAEWVVRAPPGTVLALLALSERAGTLRRKVRLGEPPAAAGTGAPAPPGG